jgi:hypothetical protein
MLWLPQTPEQGRHVDPLDAGVDRVRVQIEGSVLHRDAAAFPLAHPVGEVATRPQDEAIQVGSLFDATCVHRLEHGQEHALYEIRGQVLAAQVT